MSSKITIIGAGSVGSTIAYTLSNQDIASEIVLIDINKEKVAGEVMDIIQGTCFRDPINIKAGEYEDAKDSNIVIITSGIARKPGQTRIEPAQTWEEYVENGGGEDSVYDDMGTEALDDQMLEGTEGGPVDDGTMDDGTMDEGAADATGSGDAEVQ